jgi:signal transduction histidine kinase
LTISTRLTVLLALPVILIVLLFSDLHQRQSSALVRTELTRAGRSIARVSQLAMEDYLRDHQLDDARELVDLITGYERVLGFRLFDEHGNLIYQSTLPRHAPDIDAKLLAEVLRTRKATETQSVAGSEPLASFVLPLSNSDGAPLGAVEVMERETFIDEAASADRRSIAALTIAMLLTTGIVLFVVTRWIVGKPIAELVASFREVGSGDLSARIPVRRDDEIGRLAAGFNAMCERLQSSQRALIEEQEERRRTEEGLRKAEHLASVGQLAAGLAHEIGTPLNVIGGRAEALRKKLEGNEVASRNLSIIVSQIDRISHIVRRVLDFARAREPKVAPTPLDGVVRSVVEFLELQFEQRGVRIETDFPPDLPPALVDAEQIHQVFLNLATNALDAMPRGGTLSVRVIPPSLAESDGTGDLIVEFHDTGTGISPENLNRIFDPFFSTKDVGQGTGLGLSVSYGIVREHGGRIEVLSELERGTSVRVHLPVAVEGAAKLQRRASARAS